MKAGVPAFTAPQKEEAMGSLQKRASELEVNYRRLFLLYFWQVLLPNASQHLFFEVC